MMHNLIFHNSMSSGERFCLVIGEWTESFYPLCNIVMLFSVLNSRRFFMVVEFLTLASLITDVNFQSWWEKSGQDSNQEIISETANAFQTEPVWTYTGGFINPMNTNDQSGHFGITQQNKSKVNTQSLKVIGHLIF